MRKAGAILILAFLILVLPLIAAEDTAKVDKAYSCLEGKVKGKCSSLASTEEQAFSILALAYNGNIAGECKNALIAGIKDQECWPKPACKVKDTAIAVISLNYIGQDVSKPEAWLARQNKTPSDLLWFLEIDARDATSCTIKYDSNSTQHTVSMAADKKLSLSGSGRCLSLANGNYWLQISQSCLGKNFRVSCDKDFFTALLYKKSNSDVWYVSSKTQAASAGGTTENTINSLCFKQGSECDYEASLWATLALQQHQSVESFLPYLIANAPDNSRYSPYAFLNKISPSDEFLASIRPLQNPAGFWDAGSGYGRNYDTAISLIGLSSISDDPQVIASKDWLQSVQGADGCWPTVKDTALILYAAFSSGKSPCSGTSCGGPAEIDYCEDYGKYCSSQTECSDVSGEVLTNYHCKADALKICCSKSIEEETCSQKSGKICGSNEECSGNLVSSSDSSRCCVDGDCSEVATPGCVNNGFNCRSSCLSTEEIKTASGNDCPSSSDFCCSTKAPPTKSYLWLWILIILIILVVVAILFRNQLRMWLFNLKSKFGKGKPSSVQQTRPPFPPAAMPRGMMQRPMPRPMPQPQSRPPVKPSPERSKADQELEETMRKLKDMSK